MTPKKPNPLEQVTGLTAPPDDTIGPAIQMLEEAFLPLHDDDVRSPLPDEHFDRIMRKIDQHETAPGTSTVPMSEGIWESIAPGIERKIVYVNRSQSVQSYFVRMRAGATLQAHDHDIDEQCVILQGRLEIGGTLYEAGTYHLARRGIPHVPITARDDAIFFIHGGI